MKNILILLALMGSFVLAGCPKQDKVAPVAPSDDGPAMTGIDQDEVLEPE